MTLYNKVASGSSGNSIIYFNDIMVDLGVAYKRVSHYLKDINYLVISHKHKDHLNLSSIKRMNKNYPNIKILGNAEVIEVLENEGIDNLLKVNANEEYTLSNFVIKPVELKHDVLNYGFKIFKKVNERVLYLDNEENNKERVISIFHATDTYDLVGIEAIDFDAYFVEFNHNEKLINKNIAQKKAKKVYAYEMNSKQYHQSNERIIKWLLNNNVSGLVVPLHISNESNSKKIMNSLKDVMAEVFNWECYL